MGDLVGEALAGKLYYIRKPEFDRVRSMNAAREERTALFADMCRLNALYMIARAGSGHIGTTFSSMEIVCDLHLNEMEWRQGKPWDIYFSSKGHDVPGLYAIKMALGEMDFALLDKLRRLGGLPGHPDRRIAGLVTNTGSLGMGISKAKGMVYANRRNGKEKHVFVLTGDGELQEGQFWESLAGAVRDKMHEITVIADHNKVQSDTLVAKVNDLGDLEGKVRAFGWSVKRVNGHDVKALGEAIGAARAQSSGPTFIIADTIKGKGISFTEHTAIDFDKQNYKYHSGAPTAAEYLLGANEIIARINRRFAELSQPAPEFESAEGVGPVPPPPGSIQRLIPAYTAALLDQAEKNAALVALDADLVLDTGLIPFQQKYPDRFIECGIAEQDMVSQAGGMAIEGLLPVVHSFSCFLTARPNEQIYNNACEKTKIIYVGSLSGLIPAGPGSSHQSLREISTVGGNPNLVVVEPATEEEVHLAFDYAVNGTLQSAFVRLVSVPWALPFSLPKGYRWTEGQGVVLRDGMDIAIFGYGPITLASAWNAADLLAERGISARVVDLPFLNKLDNKWLKRAVEGVKAVLTLDNQFLHAGQGLLIAAGLAAEGGALPAVRHLGVKDYPACGRPEEVLAFHGLDAAGIAKAAMELLGK